MRNPMSSISPLQIRPLFIIDTHEHYRDLQNCPRESTWTFQNEYVAEGGGEGEWNKAQARRRPGFRLIEVRLRLARAPRNDENNDIRTHLNIVLILSASSREYTRLAVTETNLWRPLKGANAFHSENHENAHNLSLKLCLLVLSTPQLSFEPTFRGTYSFYLQGSLHK
jgi:hypothetical protein